MMSIYPYTIKMSQLIINRYVSGTSCNTERCSYDLTGKPPVAGITGYNTLTSNNMEAVMQHLAQVGPLAVNVAAYEMGMYESGVFDGCSYDESIDVNHVVVLAGYGTDPVEVGLIFLP